VGGIFGQSGHKETEAVNNRRRLGMVKSSRFRGVSFNNKVRKWKAVITIDRVQHFLGLFGDEAEAAMAYDAAALKLRGCKASVSP